MASPSGLDPPCRCQLGIYTTAAICSIQFPFCKSYRIRERVRGCHKRVESDFRHGNDMMTRGTKSTTPGRKRAAPADRVHAAAPAWERVRSDSDGQQQASLRGEFVYTRLRGDIRSGALVPGSRLRETEIAERLQVSRTPVREALKQLESEVVFSHQEVTAFCLADGSIRADSVRQV